MMFKRTKSSENYQSQRGSTIGHQKIACFRCLRSWVDLSLSNGQVVQESEMVCVDRATGLVQNYLMNKIIKSTIVSTVVLKENTKFALNCVGLTCSMSGLSHSKNQSEKEDGSPSQSLSPQLSHHGWANQSHRLQFSGLCLVGGSMSFQTSCWETET